MITYRQDGKKIIVSQRDPEGPLTVRVLEEADIFHPHLFRCIRQEENVSPGDLPDLLRSIHDHLSQP